MIILVTKSSRSARATAEHLRRATVKGPFVFFRSNDFRAVKLAVALSRRRTIVINTILLCSSLVGIFGGAVLLSIIQSSAVIDVGEMGFYWGVIVGLCLIGLEGIR